MTEFNKERPLRVFESFAGYGSQAMALNRVKQENPEFDFEVVGISEIDKYALQAYEAVHGHCPNFGDICTIDWNEVPDFDLFTYSFPCTDISNAGKQAGLSEGSGTRSGLLWECRKAIEVKRPKYLLMENVKALVGKKFIGEFEKWLAELADFGYVSYWEVMNAKNYGVPQNRERVFCLSVLGEHEPFEFPKEEELDKRLKDVLEPTVDDKFVLSDKAMEGFLDHNENHEKKQTGFVWKPKDVDGLSPGGSLEVLDDRNLKPITPDRNSDVANCLRAHCASLCATDNSILRTEINE